MWERSGGGDKAGDSLVAKERGVGDALRAVLGRGSIKASGIHAEYGRGGMSATRSASVSWSYS